MFKEVIKKVISRTNLTEEESYNIMLGIMNGELTQVQIASFITALRMKGETVEEITGCARAMRNKAEVIKPKVDYYVDTCGTGGDGSNTFNISTAVSFLLATAGVYVAKHGNRSISSMCGSSDILQELGINIMLEPEMVKKCIEEVKIGFMFAPNFHKSMKYAAGPRKELGIRSVFNILGPLTNPALANGQIMGVFDGELTNTLANVLNKLGVEKAMVVHGNDGLDEITTVTNTKVSEVKDNKVINYEINPLDYGIELAKSEDLVGGDSSENKEILLNIFKGEKGPKRDIVILNSAAGLYVAKKVENLKQGIELANEVLDSKKVLEKIDEMSKFTNK
jgi:anthranilate phosphoribosyltransferase